MADKYTVLHPFPDKEDKLHYYKAGHTYPRPGLTPSAERVAQLMGNRNAQGRPMIAPVQEPPAKPKRPATKE